MHHRINLWALLGALPLILACGSDDSGGTDATIPDGIYQEATITMADQARHVVSSETTIALPEAVYQSEEILWTGA